MILILIFVYRKVYDVFEKKSGFEMFKLIFCFITKNSFSHEDKEISYLDISRVLVNRYEPSLKENQQEGEDKKYV